MFLGFSVCQLLRGGCGGHFLEGLWPAGGTAPYFHTLPNAKQGQPHSQEVKNGISSPRVGPGWMTPCTSDLGWWVPTHRPHPHSIHKSSSPYYHSITCIFMCPYLQIHKPSSPWLCVLISVFTISSPYSQALISILMSHLHNHI